MLEIREIAVANLLLDLENPRLAEGQLDQPATIHAMLQAEGPKTLALAKSIAQEGVSPMERLLVMPSKNDQKLHIVLEGNRRVTALKILSEPALADAVLTPAQQTNLHKWSAEYRQRGEIEELECVVFEEREQANPWIERRHRGDQGGLGIVRWGATESARFDARRSGKHAPELQVLDFVAQRGVLDSATRDKLHDVSITNLKRLVRDKFVRDTLGLHLDSEGRLTRSYPEKEVLKGLTRIVRDLAHERLLVKDIYTAKDRQKYINTFKAADLPTKSKALPEMHPLTGADTTSPTSPSGTGAGKRAARHTKQRTTVVPFSCSLNISRAKTSDVFRELKRLKLEEFPNAIAVLLRVFLELSVDELVSTEGLMMGDEYKNAKLSKKLQRVATHLGANGRLSTKQAQAVRKAATDQHLLHSSITTFHAYVHNEYVPASPADLRAAFDTLQPLFEAIWA